MCEPMPGLPAKSDNQFRTTHEKDFFENVDFRQNRRRNPNRVYRLSVPRDPWDTLGHFV